MATATFAAERAMFDKQNPALTDNTLVLVGTVDLAQPKVAVYRQALEFQLFGPAFSGRPLVAGDTIVTAELIFNIDFVAGPTWNGTVDHISRADWDYITASWNNYKAATPWTNPGGDVATPPAAVPYTAPLVTGEFLLTGMAASVTDAIANKGGEARLLVKGDDETTNTTKRFSHASAIEVLLRVAYIGGDPANINYPETGTLAGEQGAKVRRPAAPAQPAPPARVRHGR